ncbi:MAG TPA: class I SAM-dependent methyltransferase [Acidobacteriota bacterium]|nr:class I SAM-dependent methyltransferase [Acidobacteriota bacterium]
MKKNTIIVSLFLAAVLAAILIFQGPAVSQEFEPSVGQAGKDVIWVPTPDDLVEAMLNAAKITPDDFLVDLGSGDGRIVIAAARRGTRALGIEYNPNMVQLSKQRAQEAGVADKATFMEADIFQSDFSKATVVAMYLLPHLNLKLRPTILEMKPGTRIVSHSFNMGDWDPDQNITTGSQRGYLWIVPANVAGVWTMTTGSNKAELDINQRYQKFEGTLKMNGNKVPIENGILNGDVISFRAGGAEYSGRVKGAAMEGTVKTNRTGVKWTATPR